MNPLPPNCNTVLPALAIVMILLYGSSLADGHEHEHENLPLLIAGGGGGTIKPGRKIQYRDNTSLSRFHLATMQRVGMKMDEFADPDEPMDELAG